MVAATVGNWRGRQTRNQDFQIPPFVPSPGPIEYIPSFLVGQPFVLVRIANGEWVIRDPAVPLPAADSQPGRPPRAPKALAPLIDAMLLAGNMTMRSIVRELQRKASAAAAWPTVTPRAAFAFDRRQALLLTPLKYCS